MLAQRNGAERINDRARLKLPYCTYKGVNCPVHCRNTVDNISKRRCSYCVLAWLHSVGAPSKAFGTFGNPQGTFRTFGKLRERSEIFGEPSGNLGNVQGTSGHIWGLRKLQGPWEPSRNHLGPAVNLRGPPGLFWELPWKQLGNPQQVTLASKFKFQ